MNATDLLERQHREVQALFARIEKTEGARERSQLLEELANNLAGHMIIEQEIFYPASARALEDTSIVAEAFEEHGVASFQLQRVLASRSRDTTFEAKVKVLRELLNHHIEEEERNLFRKIRRAMDDADLEQLGQVMLERFEQQMDEGYESVLAEPPPDAREALQARGRTTAKRSAKPARSGSTSRGRTTGTTQRKAARGTRRKSRSRTSR